MIVLLHNKLLCRSVYHYKLNVIQRDCLKVEKQFYLNDHELHFCASFGFVPYNQIWIHLSIRMVIKTSISFLVADEEGDEVFDFASRNVKQFPIS